MLAKSKKGQVTNTIDAVFWLLIIVLICVSVINFYSKNYSPDRFYTIYLSKDLGIYYEGLMSLNGAIAVEYPHSLKNFSVKLRGSGIEVESDRKKYTSNFNLFESKKKSQETHFSEVKGQDNVYFYSDSDSIKMLDKGPEVPSAIICTKSDTFFEEVYVIDSAGKFMQIGAGIPALQIGGTRVIITSEKNPENIEMGIILEEDALKERRITIGYPVGDKVRKEVSCALLNNIYEDAEEQGLFLNMMPMPDLSKGVVLKIGNVAKEKISERKIGAAINEIIEDMQE